MLPKEKNMFKTNLKRAAGVVLLAGLLAGCSLLPGGDGRICRGRLRPRWPLP